MPFWIEGWIEVARNPDTAGEHSWFGVVRLDSIVDVADEDTESLFGLSKDCVTGRKLVSSLAAGRGVPSNPSAQIREELKTIADHEAKYGAGEFGGYTFALWSEIQDFKLTDPPEGSQQKVGFGLPEGSQWKVAFGLARVLAERWGSDRIRFVVWFNW